MRKRWRVTAGNRYTDTFSDYYDAERYAVELSRNGIRSKIESYSYDPCPDCSTHDGSCRTVCFWQVPLAS